MRALFVAGYFILAFVIALNAQDQTATIIFYREPRFATSDFKPMLFCDGLEFARIDNGTYFQITVPVGMHSCTIESLKEPAIEINAVTGEKAYVHVGTTSGMKTHGMLTNTTESEFDKEKPRLKPLKEWRRNSLVTSPLAAVPEPTPAKSEQRIESTTTPATPVTPVSQASQLGEDGPNWLHPSDAEYQYALDLGFGKFRPEKKDVRPLHFVNRLQSELRSQIDVQPPLVCALNSAALSKKRLDPEPSVEDVRLPCDGSLTVTLIHFSVVLNPDRPIVLDHLGARVKPTVSTWDHNPEVTKYDAGFLAQDQVGYQYVDVHHFNVGVAWSDHATFVTADPVGKESSFVYDFGLLAQNEQQIRLQVLK